MFGLPVQCPKVILQLLPENLQLDRIVKDKVTKLSSNKEAGKHDEIITPERLSVKLFDFFLN